MLCSRGPLELGDGAAPAAELGVVAPSRLASPQGASTGRVRAPNLSSLRHGGVVAEIREQRTRGDDAPGPCLGGAKGAGSRTTGAPRVTRRTRRHAASAAGSGRDSANRHCGSSLLHRVKARLRGNDADAGVQGTDHDAPRRGTGSSKAHARGATGEGNARFRWKQLCRYWRSPIERPRITEGRGEAGWHDAPGAEAKNRGNGCRKTDVGL